MSKIKIEEVALEAGTSDKIALEKAKELGLKVRARNSTITEQEAENLMNYIITNNINSFEQKKEDVDKRIWVISPGENAAIWEECKEENYIAIGWDKINVNNYNSLKNLRKNFNNLYSSKNSRAPSFLWRFANEINIGDLIIARKGLSKIIGVGEVVGDYIEPNDNENPRIKKQFKQVRKVNWLDTNEYTLKNKKFQRNTLQELENLDKEILKIIQPFLCESKLSQGNKAMTQNDKILYSKEEIKYNFPYKNILLKGVPGTGKSRAIDNIVNNKLNPLNNPNNPAISNLLEN